MSLPSDLPPPIDEVSVIEMNDPKSPFLYDAVNSKKADPPGIRNGEFMVQNADIAMSLRTLRETMQTECPDNKFDITFFENWGTTVSSLLLYVKPKTREEVCTIIKAAKKHKIKVGMGGAYHSWSPTYPDSGGMIINTCDLVLPVAGLEDDWTSSRMILQSDRKTVTIAPGVTTGQLMQFFLDNDVCIKADVILPSVTYGGVFSGGCHGVGKSEVTMSDWIKSMTVVDGNGKIKIIPDDYISGTEFSADTILKAASASLGLFGVILEVTIEVKPMENARVKNVFSHKLSLFKKENKDKLTQLIQETDSLELFWFPYNGILDSLLVVEGKELHLGRGFPDEKEIASGKVVRLASNSSSPWWWNPWNDDLWSREINFTDNAVTKDPGVPLWSMLMDVIAGGAMTIGKAIIGSMVNKITPLTLTLGFKMLKFQYGTCQKEEVVKVPWAIHYRDAIDLNYAYDMEFAFPLNIEDPVMIQDAVQVVIDTTSSYSKKGKFYKDSNEKSNAFPLNLCMELRVMKKSKALLCPASIGNEDHIVYIEVLSTVNTPGVREYFQDISTGWKSLGGIPHWQKQWTFLDDKGDMVEYLKEKYGENLTTFKNVRTALSVDPDNMFVNSVYKHFMD